MTPSKTPVQVLTEVRELFSDKSKWTQCVHAADRRGFAVDPWDPEAACWCLDGAIALKAGVTDWDEPTEVYWGTSGHLDRLTGDMPYTGVNDDGGYEAVMALLDRAIDY